MRINRRAVEKSTRCGADAERREASARLAAVNTGPRRRCQRAGRPGRRQDWPMERSAPRRSLNVASPVFDGSVRPRSSVTQPRARASSIAFQKSNGTPPIGCAIASEGTVLVNQHVAVTQRHHRGDRTVTGPCDAHRHRLPHRRGQLSKPGERLWGKLVALSSQQEQTIEGAQQILAPALVTSELLAPGTADFALDGVLVERSEQRVLFGPQVERMEPELLAGAEGVRRPLLDLGRSSIRRQPFLPR